MPELPEVETVRCGLAPIMEGEVLEKVELRRPDLRIPFPPRFSKRLTGRTVVGLGRRAKYLLADLDNGSVLIMHLGMSGSFRIEIEGKTSPTSTYYRAQGERQAHDHVVFYLSSGAQIIFNDPRRFGLMDLVPRGDLETTKYFRAMGVEPLGNALDGKVLAQLFAGRTAPIKAILMDQRFIAGLGNIYVCEALWRARLSPERQAGSLVRKAGGPKVGLNRLATAIRDVLTAAIAAGGSTLQDHRRVDGELGTFQHEFSVYDREGAPCLSPRCRGTIRRMIQSGRSTFYCGVCQG
jgi:formamidopyrimidine-DNA glycosylase